MAKILRFQIRCLYRVLSVVPVSVLFALAFHGQAMSQAEVKFHSISELKYDPAKYKVSLIGGRPADPSKFPASFYTVSNGAACTSTLIGPRVLLSAAHCVLDGAKVALYLVADEYRGTCSRASAYRDDCWQNTPEKNCSADYALCLMDRPVPVAAYERVSVDPDLVSPGDEILLSGYGCTRENGDIVQDRIFRIGEATVKSVPNKHDWYNFIRTQKGAFLCMGDSGGAAFYFIDGDPSRRVQISVNAQTNLNAGQSSLSSLATKVGRGFIKKWAADTGGRICGIHKDVENCRW